MPQDRAAIWDMDGVIADTGLYHYRSWRHVFQERGKEYTEEDFKKNFGQRNDSIIRSNLGVTVAPEEMARIALEKEEYFRREAKGRIKPFPGVVKLIRELKDNSYKLAIASSAPPENIKMILGGIGIEDCFQAVAYGREVSEGKPSPLIFLLAARKLGIDPQYCVVFEDAIAGVTAAKNAGMLCVAVTNTNVRQNLSGADLIVDSLEEVSVNDIDNLFY